MITRSSRFGGAHPRQPSRCFVLLFSLALLAPAAASCSKVPLLAPSGSTITLTAAATALPMNGATDIIAQVLEAAGTPPQDGTVLTFLTTLGSIEPSEARTNGGRVIVKFRAGTKNGVATITASSGGASVGTNGAIKIAIGAAAVGGVSVSANPGVVPSLGGTSTITATVLDASGNLLAGIPVTFTTDAGAVSPTLAITDGNGRAQTTLTTSKTAKVTASAGVATTSSSGTTTTTTPTPSANITVNINATQAITIGTSAPAAPTVGQTVSLPLTYATTSGATPVVRVKVNWGDGSVETFSGQPGAVSHSYTAAGSYVVQVTGTDGTGDTSSTSTSITVAPRPSATVSISASANPTAGSTTTFTIGATPATNTTIQAVWVDFGDSSPVINLGAVSGTSLQVQHVYQSSGTFKPTVMVVDSNGVTTSGSTIIVVVGQPPFAVSLTSTQTASGGNTSVTFTASVPTGTSATYVWTFGDGTSATTTGNQVVHVYTTGSGAKTVTVNVTSSTGQTGTSSTTIVP